MSLQFMKRLYGPRQYYGFLLDFARTGFPQHGAETAIGKDFFERLMLAVTEVNGCRLCSYYHTQLALQSGVSEADVSQMLGGDLSTAPAEEQVALLFAQHYAESSAQPGEEAFQRLREVYSPEELREILFAIRVIMLGNTLGNTYDALRLRLKGKPAPQSRLGSELGVLLGSVVLIPAAFIQAGWEKIWGR